MRLSKVCLALAALIIVSTSISSAMSWDRQPLPDRSVVYRFNFTPGECELLRTRFGYNMQLADQVVRQLLFQVGVPSSFTSKVAIMVPAYGISMPGIAYVLWDTARHSTSFSMTFRSYPRTFAKIQRLGALGDHIMPFGEAGSLFASILNDLLNSAAASR